MVRKIDALELEGLAMNGFVVDAKIIKCWESRGVTYSKIVARLRNGEEVETECMLHERTSRLLLAIATYINLSKKLGFG